MPQSRSHNLTRRQILSTPGAATLAATLAPAPARATALTLPATPADEAFMRQTIELAQQHGKRYTALIVSGGQVIAEGINAVRGADGHVDPTAHSEMMAIRNCLAAHGAGALRGATHGAGVVGRYVAAPTPSVGT